MAKLRDILQSKGTQVHMIWPTATLQEVVDLLVRHNCGSLLVVDGGQLLGIITERDILRAVAAVNRSLSDCQVQDHMSVNLLTGNPEDAIGDVMGLMTEHRVRHLPVLEEDRLVGIVSIGDVVKAQHHQLSMENHYLKNYIQG
jgi:CBS domain-containing protein